METRRQKFLDMLGIPRVAQIPEQMDVQVVRVGVQQARRQASPRAQQVASRCAPPGAAFGVGRQHHAQQLAGSISSHHERPHEKAAVQVGPQHGNRGKQRQQRNAGDMRPAFANALERAVKQHQKQQREEVRAGQPVNRGCRRRHHRYQNRDHRVRPAAHQQVQQSKGRGDQHQGEQDHRLQSTPGVEPCEDHVAQPFPGKPRIAGL